MTSCEKSTRGCRGNTSAWLLWQPGDGEAIEVVLCEVHAEPLNAMIKIGRSVPLPKQQRAGFEITKLKTTKHTKDLKKKP